MKHFTRTEVNPLSIFVKGSERVIHSKGDPDEEFVIARLKSGPHKGKTRIQAILYRIHGK
jgi:hypothetical protein